METIKKFVAAILCILSQFLPLNLTAQPDLTLPSDFQGNRVFIETITESQDTISFLTDTGGGGILVTQDFVRRLGLESSEIKMGDQNLFVVTLPDFHPDYDIPLMPENPDEDSYLAKKKETLQGKILVVPPDAAPDVGADGILGQDWFASRVWTMDYGKQEFILHQAIGPEKLSENHTSEIYFQKDQKGKVTHYFPRIQAEIDGEMHDFLLDTGATTLVTEEAMKLKNDSLPAMRGTSFITQSIFEQWRENHPDWEVIEEGDKYTGSHYIKVPEVTIAGHTVGPVWFTTRPDPSFHNFMSSMMDKQIEGALGGSLFQYFKITLSYPDRFANFESIEEKY